MAKKDKALASATVLLSTIKASLSLIQEDLKSLRLEKAFLVQNLYEASNTDLIIVFESFEKFLLQVEHFYYSLCISREQVQSG